MPHIELNIDGMSCSKCVASVERALSAVAGVQSVQVDLASGKAQVQTQSASDSAAERAALVQAVEAAGFDVV